MVRGQREIYNLIVEEDSLKGDLLEVRVVAENDTDALVDLPRDTLISGNRIRIPKHLLLPDAKSKA